MHTNEHKEDAATNKALRHDADAAMIVPVPAAPGESRDFSAVTPFIRDFASVGGKLTAVSPAELVAHLAAEGKNRSYRAAKNRNGVVGETVRTCETPLAEITVTSHPAAADCWARGAKINPARVAEELRALALRLAPDVERLTGCRVVAVTIHTDTSTPHFNFVLSRVSPDAQGVNRLTAKDGFGLAGPWAVGVDRQRRSGVFYPPHDERFVAAMRKHSARKKKKNQKPDWPTDVALARLADNLCAALPGFAQLVTAYSVGVLLRRRDAVDTKRASLRRALASLDEAERLCDQQQQQEPKKGMTK